MMIRASETSRDGDAPSVAFEATDLVKQYPGVRALDGVSLKGYAGEVLAICGANGAGKSTLARMLAGVEKPSSGSLAIAGHDGPLNGPADALDAGILLMHQEPLIVDDFTVEENVWLSQLSTAHSARAKWTIPRGRATRTRAALDAVGASELDGARLARGLGPGLRQMVALSRSQVVEHRILVLDETSASTTEEHFRDLLALVQRERDAGVCVIFVSHRMDEVFAMSDRIAVMRNGQLVDVVQTAKTTPDAVVELMIGAAITALGEAAQVDTTAPTVLDVRDLSSGSARDVSFSVRAGEILGLYGLVGSGRSSVLRSIGGQQDRLSGSVRVDGEPADARTPGDGLKKRIAYVTEDRRREGFVKTFTNADNITLATASRDATAGVIRPRLVSKRVEQLLSAYTVKGGPATLTATLSGGNQQKVVIAKWMAAEPRVLLLDEPTKGIDVGARAAIYRLIRDFAAAGNAVVVVTSEAEEALTISSTVRVLREGKLGAEFDPRVSSTDDLIRASLGEEEK